jgi:hypothetical protein
MIAGHELGTFIATSSRATEDVDPLVPRDLKTQIAIVIFYNRGGANYLNLLKYLAEYQSEVPLLMIAPNAPEVLAEARALCEAKNPRRWLLLEKLSQADYLRRVGEVAQLHHPLFVSKAGPNTVMEALYYGMPPIVVASGLPTEEWVLKLIEREGLGRTVERPDRLIGTIDELIKNPDIIAQFKKRARLFIDRLDTDSFGAEVLRVLHRMLTEDSHCEMFDIR